MISIRTTARTASMVLLAAIAASASVRAQTTASSEIETLREQIRQLDQKLRVLERKQELKEEAAATTAKPPVVTASPAGFGLASADKVNELRLRALIQFDARFFFDDGAPNRDQFLLRRIRTPFTGTIGGIYDFNITPELGGGTNTTTTVALWDAFAAARFTPAFGLRFGKFPSAVGLEPGSNRHFIESPFVNSLMPNRDLGVEAFGTLAGGVFEYRLGVVIGAPNNTTNFGGPTPDQNDGDRTLAGRFTVNPFAQDKTSPLSKLSLGVGFSHGNEEGVAGANLSNGLANIVSQAQQAIFSFGPNLYAAGRHTRVSPSLEWYPGNPFSAAAEYTFEDQEVAVDATGLTRSFQNSAWRVTVGYVLTGEEATKSGVVPKVPFAPGGGWGAFEVVARISGLDVDSAFTRPISAGGAGLSRANNITSALAYGVGLNWYLSRAARFQVNLENTAFDGAKTPTAAIGARDDELALLTRAQLNF